MTVYSLQATFSRGELSPRLHARQDIDHYKMGLKSCVNYYVMRQGGLKRRPGTMHGGVIKSAANDAVLIPFEFSEEQAYVIEMGAGYFRFWTNGGQVESGGSPYEISNNFLQAELTEVQYVQSADALYLVHENHPPSKLIRNSETDWDLEDIVFEDGPYLDENETSTTATPTEQGQLYDLGGTVSGDYGGDEANVFDNSDATAADKTGETGYIQIDLGSGVDAVVDKYTLMANKDQPNKTPTSWEVQGSDDGSTWITVDSRTGETGWAKSERRHYEFVNLVPFRYWKFTHTGTDGGSDSQIAEWRPNVAGDTQTAWTLNFSAVTGINDDAGFTSDDVGRMLRLYGDDGKWRWAVIDSVNSTTSVEIRLYGYALHSLNGIARWRLGSFSEAEGYPSTVGYYEGRLGYGGSPEEPRKIWLSRSQDFDNMGVSQPVVDNDSVQLEMTGEMLNRVRWMKEANELIVGTSGEMRAVGKGDNGKAFSPTNANQKAHTQIGTAKFRPVIIGNTLVYADRYGRRLHEFGYSYEINAYKAPELSIMSDHLIRKGVAEMSYAQDPDNIIWLTMDDGELTGVTYEKDQSIVGITRHGIAASSGDNGDWATVKSLTVIPGAEKDEVWMIVQRTIDSVTTQHVEYFADTFEPADEGDDQEVDCVFFDSAVQYDGADTATISGLDHLEGETVGILANGVDIGDATVASGSITLPGGATCTKATIGLRFLSSCCTLRPPTHGNRDGSGLGRNMRIVEMLVDILETGHLLVGTSTDDLEEVTLPAMEDAVEDVFGLKTGSYRVHGVDSWRRGGNVYMQTDRGYPSTIRAINLGLEGEP